MSAAPVLPTAPDRFSASRYLVRRKVLKIFGGAFHIYDANEKLVFYSQQKAWKLKEDVRLFTGEDMRTEVLRIQARKVIDLAATYDVYDSASGQKVGALRRKGLKSIIKDEWLILDAQDREVGKIVEDSLALAIIRRFLTNLIPQKYYAEMSGREVCTFKQRFNPFVMKVELDFSMDPKRTLDRRLGVAATLLFCAIEGRQN
jgi:uncharacterized protein YxjI